MLIQSHTMGRGENFHNSLRAWHNGLGLGLGSFLPSNSLVYASPAPLTLSQCKSESKTHVNALWRSWGERPRNVTPSTFHLLSPLSLSSSSPMQIYIHIMLCMYYLYSGSMFERKRTSGNMIASWPRSRLKHVQLPLSSEKAQTYSSTTCLHTGSEMLQCHLHRNMFKHAPTAIGIETCSNMLQLPFSNCHLHRSM
jgi:hypothetical protein